MPKNDHVETDMTEENPVDEVETTTDADQTDETGAAEASELEKTQALVEEFKEALQRERADFQNYRRRVDREKESLRPTITADVLKRFLPVIDDLERGLDAIPESERSKDWVVGIMQIHRKFQNLLEAEGIEIINPLGDPFDPNFHEAIGTDEPTAEIGSDHITAVLQKGYRQGDRVLRPAMVRVAS